MRTINTDVVIIGAGTAGCAAAVAAARRKHSVLLVEETNALGGVSTSGGVGEWFASQQQIGDVFDEVKERLHKFGATWDRFFNHEYLKYIWQSLVEEAGADVLFHTTLLDVQKNNNRVNRVTLVGCSQKIEVTAKWFVDTSGEGDLGWIAGADFLKGHPESGTQLSMNLTCVLHDTKEKVKTYLPPDLEPIETKEQLPGLYSFVHTPDNRVHVSMTKVMEHDSTDPFELSNAELTARRQLMRVVHYLQNTFYPTHMLCASGARIGIREGRRIIGEYILTEEDILKEIDGIVFDDAVAVATSQIDFQSLTRAGHTGWRQEISPFTIPFRCLYARDFENLMMAGKCISTDQVAHSSTRMTPTCCCMGQAIGTAAALLIENGHTDIREIDVSTLQKVLLKDRIELNPAKHTPFAPEVLGKESRTDSH